MKVYYFTKISRGRSLSIAYKKISYNHLFSIKVAEKLTPLFKRTMRHDCRFLTLKSCEPFNFDVSSQISIIGLEKCYLLEIAEAFSPEIVHFAGISYILRKNIRSLPQTVQKIRPSNLLYSESSNS